MTGFDGLYINEGCRRAVCKPHIHAISMIFHSSSHPKKCKLKSKFSIDTQTHTWFEKFQKLANWAELEFDP